MYIRDLSSKSWDALNALVFYTYKWFLKFKKLQPRDSYKNVYS